MSQDALATLLQRTQDDRDLALAAVRRAQEQTRRLQLQADQLLAYRSEYQQRWAAQFRRSGTPEIVQCYRSFMERLDDALGQQHKQVEAAAAQSERLRAVLQAAELRMASVTKLVERRLDEQRRVQARRDQRQSDEHAAQRLRWRSTTTEPLGH